QGRAPHEIGIGNHRGPDDIGCIGSQVTAPDGREEMRREWTANGETVNLAQRIEQLNKTVPGPILLSEQTRLKLRSTLRLHNHGPVPIPGYHGSLVVHRALEP